jgi:hypothetical protein
MLEETEYSLEHHPQSPSLAFRIYLCHRFW